MHAQSGSRLIIEQADIDHETRRSLIEEVRSPDGEPPFQVRWADTGHELNAVGAILSTRTANVQQEIAQHRRRS